MKWATDQVNWLIIVHNYQEITATLDSIVLFLETTKIKHLIIKVKKSSHKSVVIPLSCEKFFNFHSQWQPIWSINTLLSNYSYVNGTNAILTNPLAFQRSDFCLQNTAQIVYQPVNKQTMQCKSSIICKMSPLWEYRNCLHIHRK